MSSSARTPTTSVRVDDIPVTCKDKKSIANLTRTRYGLPKNAPVQVEEVISTSSSKWAKAKVPWPTEASGFQPLYTPSDDKWTMDVVFLVGKTRSRAFTNDGFNWLSDGLPVDLPGARIILCPIRSLVHDDAPFTYNMVGEVIATALEKIHTNGPKKPLVLVGYAHGGLALKAAIGKMNEREDEHARSLIRHIVGILFFAAPYDGANTQRMEDASSKEFRDFLQSEVLRPNDYSDLSAGAPPATEREEQMTRFDVVDFHRSSDPPATVTYRESVATDGNGQTWPMGRYQSYAVNRPYDQLVRFASRDDETYQLVLSHLKRLLDRFVSSGLDHQVNTVVLGVVSVSVLHRRTVEN